MGQYVSYPTGTAFGALQCQWSEPVAAGPSTTTLRVRNNTGKLITLIGLQCVCTQTNAGAGTQLDLQNAAAQSHLAAVIDMTGAAGVPYTQNTFTGAAGNTVVNGVDIYFRLTNGGGGGNAILDGQATLFYTAEFAST